MKQIALRPGAVRPGARLAALVLTAILAATALPGLAQTKKIVNSAADLPRFTYPVSGTAVGLVEAPPAEWDPFAQKVASDIDATVTNYDIRDHAALRALLGTRLTLQLLSGTQDAQALQTVEQIRALQDKPDAKLTTGLSAIAIVRARQETKATSGPQYAAAFEREYRAELMQLPFNVVGTLLKGTKSSAEILTPALVEGSLKASVEPVVATTHQVSQDLAAALVSARYALQIAVPLKTQTVAALGEYIAKNDVHKPDIWAARDVNFTSVRGLTPVRVAIWDSGTDVSLFPSQLYTDPHTTRYDSHGLAFDLYNNLTHGTLLPLTPEQKQLYPSFRTYLKGFSDLQQSVDSPEATAVKAHIASLTPAQVPAFIEQLELFSQYIHGTHVAGIATHGNPAARIVVARLTFDYHNIPLKPTEELSRRAAADDVQYVNYFKTHGVRVVNMSWGGSPTDYEDALEKNGVSDAAQRKATAQRLFKIERDALYNAIKGAPGILFVCSAGNSNGNNQFQETIPSSFKLPNLLTVGAVDQAGEATSFTSYGENVLVDASGYQVASTVPGGGTLELSGTSMSSPEVTNLAAKLIALDPSLRPEQVIALIRRGATASPDGRLHLIDPKATVQLLRTTTSQKAGR